MPQDKETIIDDFFKSLRVAVNNIATYFPGHPLLAKSLQELQSKIEAIFNLYKSLKIAVSPGILFFDGKALPVSRLSSEMAQMFHLRKIKSLEIKPGVTSGELECFLSVLALSPKDIAQGSGVAKMLKQKNITWIVVEDLDYSGLLKEDGAQEIADPWQYLLKDALEGSQQSLQGFADKFSGLARKLSVKELSDNDELRFKVKSFMDVLKKTYPDKFKTCSKELAASIIKDKNTLNLSHPEKIRELFRDVDESDISDVFLQQVSSDEGFNPLSLDLFANVIDRDKHKNIAAIIKEKLDNPDLESRYPKIKEKLRGLFSISTNPFISEIYRSTIEVLSQPHERQKLKSFNREALRDEYRYVLIALLDEEKRKDRVSATAAKIFSELTIAVEKKDTGFINDLWNILSDKRSHGMVMDGALYELASRMSHIMEDLIINGEAPEAIDDFILMAGKSFYDPNFYFDLIFNKGKVSYPVFKVFFAFFPLEVERFSAEVKKRGADIKFIERIIENLKPIDSPAVLQIYKEILNMPGDFLKIAAVRALKSLTAIDEEPLIRLMDSENYLLRREIVGVLCSYPASRARAFDKLLKISRPFGMGNKVLLESLSMVYDLKLKEAEPYVERLAKLKMFWYGEVRRKALEVLTVIKG